jgi:2-polyprenyl-3-methyl-5-hydroxy-6-metoxy-1,4-benzoquinol methylase
MLQIKDMPFCLGAMPAFVNPSGLPSLFNFNLIANTELARLEQVDSEEINSLLNRAYSVGTTIGTPSEGTDLGLPYVDDFMAFIAKNIAIKGALLEIGAGTGFLSKRLSGEGWEVTSLEPGKGYETFWKKNEVTVINEFFPSPTITKKFDAIILYTVLEHIKDTEKFLIQLKSLLKPLGKIFIGVPNCTEELYSIDVSMLLHEHYQYFTVLSLKNTLDSAGYRSNVQESSFGRCLFASANVSTDSCSELHIDKSENKVIKKYINNINSKIEKLRTKLSKWQEEGTLGIYCPSRALNYLDQKQKYYFYDDAVEMQGKFYPPFRIKVESRQQLLLAPPQNLFIASRTFGEKIKKELINKGLNSRIYTLNDI